MKENDNIKNNCIKSNITQNSFNITCQMCGKDCEVYEQVNVAQIGQKLEWWCYCKKCNIETNHPC